MKTILKALVVVVVLAACSDSNDAKVTSSESSKPTAAADTTEASIDDSTEPTEPESTEATTTTKPPTPTTTTTAAPTTTQPTKMPDVVGKSETEARELLADLGVDDVRVLEVENVAAPGTVLDQVPNSKSTITGPVDLTIAKGLSPMPELAGKTLAEAKSYFDERGVTYVIEEQLDDVSGEGSILSTIPSAGQSIGAEVKFIVAKRPVTQFLSELTAVESACSNGNLEYGSGDIGVNGSTQQNSIWFTSRGDPVGTTCYADFNLSRDWQTLRGAVGVSDTSNGNSQCQFEVFIDNGATGVFNQTAVLGVLTPVEIDITDALRVRLRVTMVSTTTTDCVWATIRLVGSGGSD